jgi:hypothetical protein
MPSKDFTANQIRVTKLIASGGLSGGGAQSGNNIGMAIYSASNASDIAGGISDSSMLNQVGKDVFLFVSGSTTPSGRGVDGGSITVFGGDVHVSGSFSGGGAKHVQNGHGKFGSSGASNGRPVNWIENTTLPTDPSHYFGDVEGNLTMPFGGIIKKVILTFALDASEGSSNLAITLYKNANASHIEQQTGTSFGDLTLKASNINASGHNMYVYQENFNSSFVEGDLLQVRISKSAGAVPECSVMMIYEES